MTARGEAISVNEKHIISKITWKLVPFLVLVYLVAYIDRTAVAFAKLQMSTDVGISDAAYGLGAGLFFIGYFLFEVPSNLVLARYGARRCFARIMISWGLITVAMALVQGPYSFYILRFLLGAAEAGFFPGVLYYLTRWYPVRYRARATGLFVLAMPLAYIITGPVSGLLLSVDGLAGLHGWQWLFICMGLPAILLAVPTLCWLPDTPAQVNWLSRGEKDWLQQQMDKDSQAYASPAPMNILAALKDPRVLLLCLVYMPLPLSVYGLSLWMPTLIKAFGTSDMATGFIYAMPYFMGIAGLLIIPRSSDRRDDRYGHLAAMYLLAAVSMFLSGWLHAAVAQLVALGFVAFALFPINALFWALSGRFLSGTGAAAAIALINSVGNLGGYIGPFAVGWITQLTGSLASGLYFLTVILLLGVLFTCVVYLALEKRRPKAG